MIGSLISMAGYWAVMFILVLWMVIRTYRASPVLAILMFFFWPCALIALIVNWGDEDSDIRTPFFLTLVAGGMMMFMAVRSVNKAIDEAAPYMSDEEIMLIRQEDPEMADRLEAARAAAWADADGEYGYDEDYADSQSASRYRSGARFASSETQTVAAPRRELSEAEQLAARQKSLELAASGLSYQYARQPVPEARASLSIPGRFRLAPSRSLPMIARLRGDSLTPSLRGWLIHEGVDMSRDDAWVVEWHMVADVAAAPKAAIPAALRSAVDSTATVEGPIPLSWSEDGQQLQWFSVSNELEAANVFAARRVHGGWFVFAMRGAASDRHELAMRATRLFASRVSPTDRA